MKIIIIGAGPGGYETAVEAAARGIEVVIVSDGPLGGTCLNEGCIPTKCMCSMDKPDQVRKNAVVAQLQSGIASLLKNKLITLVRGKAAFAGPRSVRVGDEVYSADAVVIATGSVPAFLPIPGKELCVSSTEMLDLQEVPSRLCVIGGGVIGLEFASIFNRFGSEVTVLEYCPNVLPRFDADLSKRLKASLAKRGIRIETGARVLGVDKNDCFSVSFERKESLFRVDADLVLMAVGRRPNLASLNLDEAGIEYGPRGIAVDGNFQTNVPGVYAVGDITGGMMLAHVATFQGLRALNHICSVSDGIDFSVVPSAVFTVPEVASVGKSEEECKAAGIDFKIHKSFYRANGKAVAMDETEGFCKIVEDASSGRIIGAHLMGAHSSDIIHELSAFVALGVTVSKARSLIHSHPTLSEVVLSALRS